MQQKAGKARETCSIFNSILTMYFYKMAMKAVYCAFKCRSTLVVIMRKL